jgi:CHAT domain-containing protein
MSFWRGLEQSGLGPEDAQLHQRREAVAELRDRLGHAAPGEQEQLENQLARARQGLLGQLADLRQRNPDFETLVTTDPAELLALQAGLGPHDVVVQLYPGEDVLSFQVVRRDGVTFRQQRIARRRLFELIQRVRRTVSNPQEDPNPALGELSDQLLAPLLSDLPERGNLWLLPTSELWYVPWDALPRQGRPLGDSLVVTCLSSQDLNSLPHPPVRGQGPALVVGAPDQHDLPGSWSEARRVSQEVQGRLLLGPEASKARLFELGRGARLLHLATHSRVQPGNLNGSYLLLADSHLELREIFGLQLAPGALVVLSSCESGTAQDHPGREVTSLAYAFHAAGATSVISTLWPIDDAAQSQLITAFYQGLGKGLSRAGALSEAKRALRSQPATAHPFYWAGLYLLGDPR